MKTLTCKLTVIVALSMLTTAVALTQNPSSGEITDNPDINAGQVAISVELAQTRTSPPAAPARPSVPAPAPIPVQIPNVPSSVSVEMVNNDVSNLVQRLSFGPRSGDTGSILVIPSSQTSTEDLITINEDMNVMSRIFVKNLEENRITTSHGGMFVSRTDAFTTFLGGGRSEMQSMYLQGFGALFMMKVDFPLTPSSEVQEEEKAAQGEEQGDAVWQKTRQEMFEPGKVVISRKADRPESRYDAEKVENLKTTLIKSLKHAANIRCLKPEESVILTVVGRGDEAGTTIAAARVVPGENQILIQERTSDGKVINKMVSRNSLDYIGLSSPTVLVIRTKKSDIDVFSKGDIDFEKFRRQVTLLTYPLLGVAGDGNADPFSPYIQLRSTSSSNMR